MLLAVGRQTMLVESFLHSAQTTGGIVLACDVDNQATGLELAHRCLISPRWDSPEYPAWLLSTCARHEVALLLTLHEHDLRILEQARPALKRLGTVLLGTPRTSVDTLIDKLALAALLETAGLRAPPTLSASEMIRYPDELPSPLHVKARAGRASLGVAAFTHKDAFLCWAENLESPDDFIVQPRLQGPEYGMDIVNDLDGAYAGYLGRRKLRMAGGETDRAVTVKDPRLDGIAQELSRAIGHLGPFDVDLIDHHGQLTIIDVNPRFGDGYAFNHVAGANLPAQLLAWRSGETGANHLSYKPGIIAQRQSRVQAVKPSIGTDAESLPQ